MFYEIFFGIVLGVIVSIGVAGGIHYLAWHVWGKSNFEAMKRRHEEQLERVERRLRERQG